MASIFLFRPLPTILKPTSDVQDETDVQNLSYIGIPLVASPQPTQAKFI